MAYSLRGKRAAIASLLYQRCNVNGALTSYELKRLYIGDYNVICPDNIGNWYVMRSTGSSFVDDGAWITGKYGNWDGASNRIRNADVDGEGKADIVIGPDANGNWYVMRPNPGIPDLLTSVSNGLGGTTTITYKPSTQYTNTQLPFPVQTVSEVKTNDGNSNDSITVYDYSGGFYHTGEHDFVVLITPRLPALQERLPRPGFIREMTLPWM